MREYANKPQNASRTLDSHPNASRQPPITEILQAYKNGNSAENTILNRPVEIENWQQTGFIANTKPSNKANNTNVIQQKIYINTYQYLPVAGDNEEIKAARADNFIRRYDNEEEIRSHFADNPSKYGLIKNIALWYKIPYLNGAEKKFFVLGESHAGVKGTDIARESNIQPDRVFYEGHPDSWSVAESGKRYDPGNKSPDEISSKLLRALELIFNQLREKKGVLTSSAPSGDEIPKIPDGQKSTRKSDDGTYRLVIKGEGEKGIYWTPDAEATNIAPNNYNTGDQALLAIKEMAPKVLTEDFLDELYDSDKINEKTYTIVLNALIYLRNGTYDDPIKFGVLPKDVLNVKVNIISYIINAVKIALDNNNKNYLKSETGKNTDYYRDRFMLDAINKVPNGRFDFAAIGDAHLRNIRSSLNEDIPSIPMAEFYTSTYSEDAVDVP